MEVIGIRGQPVTYEMVSFSLVVGVVAPSSSDGEGTTSVRVGNFGPRCERLRFAF